MMKRSLASLFFVGTIVLTGAGCAPSPEPIAIPAEKQAAQIQLVEESSPTSTDAITEASSTQRNEDDTAPTTTAAKSAKTETGSKPADSNPQKTQEFTITATNFSYDIKNISVKQDTLVTIIFKNAEGTHDWKLDEFRAATKRIGTGARETIQFTADKKGTFEYYCSVGNHRAMGMKGTLTVE